MSPRPPPHARRAAGGEVTEVPDARDPPRRGVIDDGAQCSHVSVDVGEDGDVVSELEDRAAEGQLEAARPLLEQLEPMAEQLARQVSGLSLETLRDRGTDRQLRPGSELLRQQAGKN